MRKKSKRKAPQNKKKKTKQRIEYVKKITQREHPAHAALIDDVIHGDKKPLAERQAKLAPFDISIDEIERSLLLANLFGRTCAWYVFSERRADDWYEILHAKICEDGMNAYSLYAETKSFLIKHGFKPVNSYQYLDVIAYRTRQEKYLSNYPISNRVKVLTKHFGIVTGENQVTSKFGNSAVYTHPMTLIPPCYGEEYIGFRKPVDYH